MKKIIIYSNETCPYCKQIKEGLTKDNIVFESRITNEHEEEWKNVITLTGIPSVPTILYEDEYFVPGRDFRSHPHLVEILKSYKKSGFPSDKIISEQLKTLNYNIQSAFGRTNQLLTQIENKLKIEDNEHKSTS